MTSSLLICPDCQGENALDSRFCRHCGHAFDAATALVTDTATTAAPATAAPATAAPATATPTILAPGEIVDEPLSSPGEIDARRATQLLDRALHLSERGDAGGAILACRQSIALAPGASDGHAMLGLLLERAGDLPHAMAAYEKATQFAPDGVIEREGLERLQQKIEAQQQNQPSDTAFHFDDDELFTDEANGVAAPATAVIAGTGAAEMVAAEDALAEVSAGSSGNETASSAGATGEEIEAKIAAASEADALLADRSPGATEAEAAALTAALTAPPAPPAPAAAAAAAAAKPASKAKAAPVTVERRVKARRRFNVPITVERRNGFDRRAAATAVSGVSPRGSAPISLPSTGRSASPVVAPIFAAPVAAPSNGWANLWSRPSYFGRSLPLAGVTVLALGLLSAARSGAVARSVEAQMKAASLATGSGSGVNSNGGSSVGSSAGSSGVDAPSAPQSGSASGLPPLAPIGPSQPQVQGIAPISNAPATNSPSLSAAPAAPAAPASTGSGAGSNAGNGARAATTRSNTGSRAPRFPQILPPAAVPPARSTGNRDGNSGGADPLALPAPNIGSNAPVAPPVNVLPPGSGSALDPAGSSGRGYVRITQGRIGTRGAAPLPQRPSAQGNTDERAAASASSSGQTDRAIERLGASINASASDAGYRYQQRATLFLERGDYSRAADDFQSAITAYNAQIDRGEQVASARAGLRAARSGLNLALAGGR